MNKFCLFLSILFFSNCYITNHKNAVGKVRSTSFVNTPFAYENGYSDVQIQKTTLNSKTTLNFIKFSDTYYTNILGSHMYNSFGKWDTISPLKNSQRPILLWQNIKLLSSSNKLYNVGTFGITNNKERYAAVFVLDSDLNDCLKNDTDERKSLIGYFENAAISADMNIIFEYIGTSSEYKIDSINRTKNQW